MQKVHENIALAVKPCIAEILIPQTQNAPNRHTGLCRTKLDKCLGSQTCNMQHATISATWICRPEMFTKQKASKRHMPTGPSCTGRGAIPCHLQSHCANGLGHGMVTAGKESGGYHNRADII